MRAADYPERSALASGVVGVDAKDGGETLSRQLSSASPAVWINARLCDASQRHLFYEKWFGSQPLKILWLCKALALRLSLLCQISLNLHPDPLPASVWAQEEQQV